MFQVRCYPVRQPQLLHWNWKTPSSGGVPIVSSLSLRTRSVLPDQEDSHGSSQPRILSNDRWLGRVEYPYSIGIQCEGDSENKIQKVVCQELHIPCSGSRHVPFFFPNLIQNTGSFYHPMLVE